jgi:AcrR family transcriptional regulator
MNTRLSADQRKDEIVLAAMPLFAQKGFHGTTTKDIAQAAGVSEALLYKHFPSKTALFDKIKDHCCVSTDNIGQELVKLEPSTETLILTMYCITNFIWIGVDGIENNILTKKLMMASLREDGEFAKQFLHSKFLPYFPKMMESFQAARESGDLNTNMPFEDLIWFAHHFITGAALFNIPAKPITEYRAKSDNELINNMAKFILKGIGLSNESIDKYFKPVKFKQFLNF